MSSSPKAFTLLEVMAVVLILGLLATATTFSLAERMPSVGRADVVRRLSFEDAAARLAARRTGNPVLLRLDVDHQRLSRVDDPEGRVQSAHSWKLPNDIRITQIRRPVDPKTGQPNAGDTAIIDAGTVDIRFNADGCCQTYALRLSLASTPSESSSNEETLWIVVAGLTGQEMLFTHEDDVAKLLAALGTPRPDAR